MTIIVECSHTGCDARVDVFTEAEWSPVSARRRKFLAGVYGETDVVEIHLPETWRVQSASSGDFVIHCPKHVTR